MIRTEADITPAVLAAMERTNDARLREIMVSLVEHLHGFVRDARLTEPEIRRAAEILNAIGKASTDSHNEAILLAGSLGVSSLVCLLNNGDGGTTETTQNLLGPFWRRNAPDAEQGESLVRSETAGDPMLVHLTIVDIWHASPAGFYKNQDPCQADFNLRGTFWSGEDGQVRFRSVRPSGYPIPTDTVVGRLLEAQDRHPYRPAHIHRLAYKDGFKTLITQVYADDDPWLETDVQFGVTKALCGHFVRHDESHPEHADLGAPYYSLDHTLVMETGMASWPQAPIQ